MTYNDVHVRRQRIDRRSINNAQACKKLLVLHELKVRSIKNINPVLRNSEMMQNQLPHVLLKLHFSLTRTTKQDLHEVNIFSNKAFFGLCCKNCWNP